MDDEHYRRHCLDVLALFCQFMQQQTEACSPDDPQRELNDAFARLGDDQHLFREGPALVVRLFTSCPQLSPLFPRELLWYLGGDCLHYMPDEEIAVYQQLDELRLQASSAGQQLDYNEARAKLLKLQ